MENTISTNAITISSGSSFTDSDCLPNTSSTTTGKGVSDSFSITTYPWRYWDYNHTFRDNEKIECPLACKKEKKMKKKEKRYLPEIKKVIFNPPATIVIWKDNSKTIVKCEDGTDFDRWTGLSMAIAKKALGDDYHKIFKKHCLRLIDAVDVREL